MSFSIAERNSFRAQLIIGELRRAGVGFFAVAPGSRSAPLTCALADSHQVELISAIHYDERGCGFAALGYARATGRPAAVICSSGTAVANLLPAVVEAAMDRIPLILLTADRPAELHNIGANQTIDQRGIFGSYPRYEIELIDSGDVIDAAQLLSTIDTAVYRSMRSPAGPVHINCPFAEPLEPADTGRLFAASAVAEKWKKEKEPFRLHSRPVVTLDKTTIMRIAEKIAKTKSGLIVAGRTRQREDSDAIRKLAERLGWPIYADIQSGLRLGNKSEYLIPSFDYLLAGEDAEKKFNPEMVLHFGAVPTSKRLLQWLGRIHPKSYIQFVDHPMILDPMHVVTDRIGCDTVEACNLLLGLLKKTKEKNPATHVQSLAGKLDKKIDNHLEKLTATTEPGVARLISGLIPKSHALFLASSMPVRDMDTFASTEGAAVPVGVNRGASGIDGTIASACGFARGHERPVTLIIGDLAMLHDLNSLALAAESPYPITIIVLNNDGGGIFHFLPIADATPRFEKWFATPHGMNFEHAASMFKLDYTSAETVDSLATAYKRAARSDRSTIIEVRTDRQENLRLHRQLLSFAKDRD